ncbi:MAG: MraY family glycosyltransferase, partial [Solirubrobacteraceae bacterium]
MQPEVALPAAFAVAALSTFALTPLAIRLALRTGFLDRPLGYKGHARPTPYLGGVALAGGVSVAALIFGAATSTYAVLLVCALGLWALGTLDDRRNLSPLTRVAAEVCVGLLLWGTGFGWDVLGSASADALLTVLWVVGIVNAFNLMDNMNGAAASTAGVSALGAAGLALGGGEPALAALCLAIAGACAGFLPFNLARPSKIFMGDGGSMLLGSLVAAVTMSAASLGAAHPSAIVVGALVAGLAILDTTLVTVSRRRGGRPLLSGGRDHLTHRLARRLGSAQRVPLALAGGQTVLCAVAIAAAHADPAWVLTAG